MAHELSTLLLTLTDSYHRIHLFQNMPVSVGFVAGMALGFQTPVTVYQYDPDKTQYFPVLQLEKLGG